jgi:CheY-like chemotaxis protein
MNSVQVLVIDDDQMMRRLIEMMLKHLGNMTFRHADNGQRGAQAARLDPPDLILLDFDMPVMDGLDTLRQLRGNAATACTPVVAVTATQRSAPRCAEMIEACDAYLPKPFCAADLLRVVQAVIDGHPA